jgi:hypothetical protein
MNSDTLVKIGFHIAFVAFLISLAFKATYIIGAILIGIVIGIAFAWSVYSGDWKK